MKSILHIYDLDAQRADVLATYDGHYEAPNWHPAGDHLLVNGQGRLFRVPLIDPRLAPIDTGFATRLNNDHGVSPDGAVLYLSDKTETGKTCIYRMTYPNGVPKRVTHIVPSYWHGVSPLGDVIAYAGFRNDICQIITADPNGCGEQILTSGFDHCDGPDFSADGQWIWFNGEKDGAVDLWRMHRDGSALERMTKDDSVNWFPHPDPTGTHVLYLAYPPGTKGHPANLPVTLRLMPAQGGPCRDLLGIFGGQGSLNVPSWSPDGKAFAFFSYDLA